MAFTLFCRLRAALSSDEDTDPATSPLYLLPGGVARHNVTYYRRETVELDEGDSRTIALPNHVQGSWTLILARVVGPDGQTVGSAKLVTVGVDTDGSTPIEGQTIGYGIDAHPGVIGMTTYNVTSFTLTGLVDGSKVTYLAAILAEDDEL